MLACIAIYILLKVVSLGTMCHSSVIGYLVAHLYAVIIM